MRRNPVNPIRRGYDPVHPFRSLACIGHDAGPCPTTELRGSAQTSHRVAEAEFLSDFCELTKGKLLCEGFKDEPCKLLALPFHLGIDQQDRIWVTNKGSDFVTRFPAADPSQVQTFKAGYGGGGLAIDSRGNVWITNNFGSSERGKAALEELLRLMNTGGNYDEYLARTMLKQQGGPNGGSGTLLKPDGSEMPGSPFTGGGLPGPFALVVDGNDNVWFSNFGGGAQSPITELCGVRTETLPARNENR